MRRIREVVIAVVFAVLALVGGPSTASALSPGAVISQSYGGGGNSGAPYNSDFVELFNRGSSSVSLTGWSLQYASATGTGNLGANSSQITELTGSLAPGGHLLVQGAGGATGAALPAPDVTDPTPINMSATAGKVALVNSTAPLGCNGGSTPCSPAALSSIVDLVGYGSANFFEGSGPAPALTNTTAALRSTAGCTETDDNAADFGSGAPNPHNGASAATPCTTDQAPALASSSPSAGAGGVPVDADVSLTFTEPVDVAGTWFQIACATSGIHHATVSGGPVTFTLDPTSDFAAGESCKVNLTAANVTDRDGDDPPDAMASDAGFSFTTVLPLTPIHAIQGAAHLSPLASQTVRTSGIVTARRSNGFYLQDPAPDADDATSEAIFVFTSGAPGAAVGDQVTVTGRVSEFRPGGSGGTGNLTTTELTAPSVTVLSSGNEPPAPVLVGPGGRVAPGETIEDDAGGNVESGGVFDPPADALDFYESLEGMRVRVDDASVTGPTRDFGSNREIPVLPGGGLGSSLLTPRGGIVIRPGDFNPERLILNDLIAGGPTLPAADTGDAFPGATVGVVDYSFGNFKLQVSQLPPQSSGGLQRESATPAGPGQLAFATFNVENLDPTDPPAKFAALAGLIVDHLGAPDLISLEEVQDDNGATDDGTVGAATTYRMLIEALRSAGGPAYDYRQIDPENDRDGGEPGGNIRVGFLFRSDRGLRFVDRPGGTATQGVQVTDGAAGPELSASPGRIDPTNDAFTTSRKPLAGEFSYAGRRLFVIANHWNSKGGDQPLFGRFQPPGRSSEVQRNRQARVVHDFVAEILGRDPHADVVVLGDLNDFPFSTALQTLVGDPPLLDDLITGLPESERYSYVFEGNSQVLDHVLMSPAASARLSRFDAVHVNAEFADQASDHDPLVATACADVDAPVLSVSASPSVLWPPNHKHVTVNVTTNASDTADPAPAVEFLSATSDEPDDAPGPADGATRDDVVVVDDHTLRLRAERSDRGDGRVYTITYRTRDACGNATTEHASVTVPIGT